MSDLESNAKDNAANTIELDDVEESIAAPHKSSRKWAWIGASVFGVALFAAVGASLGKRNDAGTPSARARERQVQVEMQRADYDLYAEDDGAEGRLREPVCWVHGPDNLPVKVVSYSASEIVFAKDQVHARNDIVCGGGGRAAAPGRRRLHHAWWHIWVPRCTRHNRDCYVGGGVSEAGRGGSTHASLKCETDHWEIGPIKQETDVVLDISQQGNVVEHERTMRCQHKGYYHPYVNGEPRYDYEIYAGVWGSITVGYRGHEVHCNTGHGSGCTTHQTCVDYDEIC